MSRMLKLSVVFLSALLSIPYHCDASCLPPNYCTKQHVGGVYRSSQIVCDESNELQVQNYSDPDCSGSFTMNDLNVDDLTALLFSCDAELECTQYVVARRYMVSDTMECTDSSDWAEYIFPTGCTTRTDVNETADIWVSCDRESFNVSILNYQDRELAEQCGMEATPYHERTVRVIAGCPFTVINMNGGNITEINGTDGYGMEIVECHDAARRGVAGLVGLLGFVSTLLML